MPFDMPISGLALNRTAPAPLHRQLFDQLAAMILSGDMPLGSDLPSTRALATTLGVSRNTVSWAYERLMSERYIATRQGAPARVALKIAPPDRSRPVEPPHAPPPRTALHRAGELRNAHQTHRPTVPRGSFWPFVPDLRPFPFACWQRLLARRIHGGCREDMTYDRPAGLPDLRALVAEHLRLGRGIRCRPEQVIITHGGQAAIDLIFRLVLRPGDRAWVEEPGYTGAVAAARAAGATTIPLYVSPETGWDMSAPQGPAPRAVYVTPGCQQPYCRVMPADQREWLVDYVHRHDAWIIEDDFDNDFFPSPVAAPSVQSLDGGARTFHVGTFSKTMFPALRIGYAVVPEGFVTSAVDAVYVAGHSAGLAMQGALCDFILQGHFARHTARMRRLYAERKAHLLTLLHQQLADWLVPAPGPVGLALPALMRADMEDIRPCAAAQARGLRIPGISSRYHHGPGRHGMLLGFCAMTPEEMTANMAILRDSLSVAET